VSVYYTVPYGVQSELIREALDTLKESGIDKRAFQAEVRSRLEAEETLKAEREYSELRGQLKLLVRVFVRNQEIYDEDISGIGLKSLSRTFVKGIWNLLPADQRPEDGFEPFINALEDKGLLNEEE
jgi:hypothetical protein